MPKRNRPAAPTTDAAEAIRVLHEVELAGLKGQLADEKEKYRELLRTFQAEKERLEEQLEIRKILKTAVPKHFSVKATGKPGEATAVALLSDWHVEERVDPNTVNGLNEFNPTIAGRRVDKLWQNLLSLVDMVRKKSRVEVLVLALMGDFITNEIHDDLKSSNYLLPAPAVKLAFRLLTGGINLLLEHGDFKRIIVPCNFGNHGRMTEKMRIKTAAGTSIEWLMYDFMADKYKDESRLEFNIADGYHAYVNVYGKTLRFHHGDAIKYRDGVGGLTIPLNKKIAKWNQGRHADITNGAHWHQLLWQRDFVQNGSLIGYSDLSIKMGSSYEEPCQAFFLMHPKYGKTVQSQIWLE